MILLKFLYNFYHLLKLKEIVQVSGITLLMNFWLLSNRRSTPLNIKTIPWKRCHSHMCLVSLPNVCQICILVGFTRDEVAFLFTNYIQCLQLDLCVYPWCRWELIGSRFVRVEFCRNLSPLCLSVGGRDRPTLSNSRRTKPETRNRG